MKNNSRPLNDKEKKLTDTYSSFLDKTWNNSNPQQAAASMLIAALFTTLTFLKKK